MITFRKDDQNNYYCYDSKTQIETNLGEPKLEKSTGKYWFKLPENEYNRKSYSKNDIDNGKTTLDEVRTPRIMTNSNSSTPKTSNSWYQYTTDEEKAIIEQIKEKALKRHKRELIEAEIEKLQKELDEE